MKNALKFESSAMLASRITPWNTCEIRTDSKQNHVRRSKNIYSNATIFQNNMPENTNDINTDTWLSRKELIDIVVKQFAIKSIGKQHHYWVLQHFPNDTFITHMPVITAIRHSSHSYFPRKHSYWYKNDL